MLSYIYSGCTHYLSLERLSECFHAGSGQVIKSRQIIQKTQNKTMLHYPDHPASDDVVDTGTRFFLNDPRPSDASSGISNGTVS